MYKFIELEVGKYYRLVLGGNMRGFCTVGKIREINDHKWPDRTLSSISFFVSMPIRGKTMDCGCYYWDHGFGPAVVTRDDNHEFEIPYFPYTHSSCLQIAAAVELDIKTDEDYFRYCSEAANRAGIRLTNIDNWSFRGCTT